MARGRGSGRGRGRDGVRVGVELRLGIRFGVGFGFGSPERPWAKRYSSKLPYLFRARVRVRVEVGAGARVHLTGDARLQPPEGIEGDSAVREQAHLGRRVRARVRAKVRFRVKVRA